MFKLLYCISILKFNASQIRHIYSFDSEGCQQLVKIARIKGFVAEQYSKKFVQLFNLIVTRLLQRCVYRSSLTSLDYCSQ